MYELAHRLHVRDCKVDTVYLLCLHETNAPLKKGMQNSLYLSACIVTFSVFRNKTIFRLLRRMLS